MDFIRNEDCLRCIHPDFPCGCGCGSKQISGIQYSVVTDMVTEPVSVTEFREHSRIDDHVDDSLLTTYLKAARQYIEGFTQKSLGEKTMRITYQSLPAMHKLMYGPVVSTSAAGVELSGNIVTSAPAGPGSFEYFAGYEVCPDLLKVAILRYAAGMYEIRENVILDERGGVAHGPDALDEAEKLAYRYKEIIKFF